MAGPSQRHSGERCLICPKRTRRHWPQLSVRPPQRRCAERFCTRLRHWERSFQSKVQTNGLDDIAHGSMSFASRQLRNRETSMFRSDAQKCQAIRLLLRSLGLEYLWTERGPTAKAVEWLDGSPLSSGENVLLRTAFEFWNQQGNVMLGRDLLNVLDSRRFEKVLTLALAVHSGAEAVDQWIEGELNQTPIRWARDTERVGQRNEEMHTALIELVSAVQDAQRRHAAGDPNAIAWNAMATPLKQAIEAIIHYR